MSFTKLNDEVDVVKSEKSAFTKITVPSIYNNNTDLTYKSVQKYISIYPTHSMRISKEALCNLSITFNANQ